MSTIDFKHLTDRELDIRIGIAIGKWTPLEETQDPKSLWPDIALAKAINANPPIPRYCSSLDKIHELEKLLPPMDEPFCSRVAGHRTWMYGINLCEILGMRLYDNGKWIGGHIGWLPLLWATPRQKAEAFLKTIEDSNERKKQTGY